MFQIPSFQAASSNCIYAMQQIDRALDTTTKLTTHQKIKIKTHKKIKMEMSVASTGQMKKLDKNKLIKVTIYQYQLLYKLFLYKHY